MQTLFLKRLPSSGFVTVNRPRFFSSNYKDVLKHLRETSFLNPSATENEAEKVDKLIIDSIENTQKRKLDSKNIGVPKIAEYQKVQKHKMKEKMTNPKHVMSEIEQIFSGSSLWATSHSIAAPIPPPTLTSVASTTLSSLYNPNLIWDRFGHKASIAEVEAIAMTSQIIGMNPEKSGGFFTFGGTATTMYALKMAAQKLFPKSGRNGMKESMKVITCSASRYPKHHAMNWLGMGTKNLVQVLPKDNCSVDMEVLEKECRNILSSGEKLGCIIANCGSLDNFGMDNLEEIAGLRKQLCKEYNLDYVPHLHMDASVGWIWSVFNHYDFKENKMGFDKGTVESLQNTVQFTKHIHLADTVGVDFHKTGYAPIPASVFIAKNREEISHLKKDSAIVPFLMSDEGYCPGAFTLETSRSAYGPIAALSNMKMLGYEGFRALIGHNVAMTQRLKKSLDERSDCIVLNESLPGFLVNFRIYPKDVDAKATFAEEMNSSDHRSELMNYNGYNRSILDVLLYKSEISLGKTECLFLTKYDEPVVALKAVSLSPFCSEESIDKFVNEVEQASSTIQNYRNMQGYGGG